MSALSSMTGFAHCEGQVFAQPARLEIRSLNHRYLDLKVRLPKELSFLEPGLRSLLSQSFKRGSVELKFEFLEATEEKSADYHPNLSVAAHYYESLVRLQRTLGLKDEVSTSDILSFPDVFTKNITKSTLTEHEDTITQEVMELAKKAVTSLQEVRQREGNQIKEVFGQALPQLKDKITAIGKRREECAKGYPDRIRDRIQKLFEAYPVEGDMSQVLESRLAQELSVLLDRTDVEEELNRFRGHLDHLTEVLEGGSPAGRKVEFVLQELNREANTLGNKAQDYAIGEDIVELKVVLDQLREQVMNVE